MTTKVVSAQSVLGDLIHQPAVRTSRTATLAEAADAMACAGVSSLLIDDEGIVTERDIVRAIGRGVDVASAVAEVATWHPIAVPAATSVIDAAATMLNEHVRHLVVRMPFGTGIVSMRDVTAVLLQAANPEIWLRTLRVAITSPAEIWLG